MKTLALLLACAAVCSAQLFRPRTRIVPGVRTVFRTVTPVHTVPSFVRTVPNVMRTVPNAVRTVPNIVRTIPSVVRTVPSSVPTVPSGVFGGVPTLSGGLGGGISNGCLFPRHIWPANLGPNVDGPTVGNPCFPPPNAKDLFEAQALAQSQPGLRVFVAPDGDVEVRDQFGFEASESLDPRVRAQFEFNKEFGGF